MDANAVRVEHHFTPNRVAVLTLPYSPLAVEAARHRAQVPFNVIARGNTLEQPRAGGTDWYASLAMTVGVAERTNRHAASQRPNRERCYDLCHGWWQAAEKGERRRAKPRSLS